jgi:hypothetical protein
MTCIGNGPNFMIGTIKEESSVKMPTFFGYTVYRFMVVRPVLIGRLSLRVLFPY